MSMAMAMPTDNPAMLINELVRFFSKFLQAVLKKFQYIGLSLDSGIFRKHEPENDFQECARCVNGYKLKSWGIRMSGRVSGGDTGRVQFSDKLTHPERSFILTAKSKICIWFTRLTLLFGANI